MYWLILSGSAIGVVVFVKFVVVICVAPGKMSTKVKQVATVFYGVNFAHRGLYTEDQSIPENSLHAFEEARKAGYGVEIDVQLTKDEQLVVFHDYSVDRACGVHAPVNGMDVKNLSQLSLFNTEETIPLLKEVMDVLGDTPVIVEIKSAGAEKNSILCEKILETLQSYGENWCIESFDPRVVKWFRKNAPEVFRGQLARKPQDYIGISRMLAFCLGNLLTNFISRPHYIAYSNDPCSWTVRLCYLFRPKRAVWTVKPSDDIKLLEEKNDFLIFEHYKPVVRYKDSA
ncbi:MAG: glycerophosphodiester phosphodiesterase [Oscillospiraceae bacterium]|jgi:glycerophosphoryl diester phosphodiesterase|nr:glycerophosphodiester phosphodiesterase [Oscillospiraceae bacterium]